MRLEILATGKKGYYTGIIIEIESFLQLKYFWRDGR
jgi:hypothetical protein